MKLDANDKELIQEAQALVDPREIKGGVLGEVGCVLVTEHGRKFSGVCLHLACGIGFCAEHTAVSQMVTQTKETCVKKIVACNAEGAIPPCGRCRELLNILDERNLKTEIVISDTEKVFLRDLLPYHWECG